MATSKDKSYHGKNNKSRNRSKGKNYKSTNPHEAPKLQDRNTPNGYVPGEVNDFSWYNNNPSLTLGVANIPYPYRPGMEVPITVSNGTVHGMTIPGVFAIEWAPTVGQSKDNQSPISIAAREMYGRVRANYSGSLQADAPDMIIYIQAMDSIYSYLAWLKRLYRMVNAQSPDNYTLPDVALAAIGISKTTAKILRTRKMDLYSVINTLIGMSDKFRVPAVYPLLKRHVWLNDRVYSDAPTLNSQLYVFNQKRLYKFALKNTPDGVAAGGLEMVNFPSLGSDPVASLYNFGADLMNTLAAADTTYTISGYLERAYQGVPLFGIAPLAIDEKLDCAYDETVLSQIENAVWAFDIKAGTNDVSQDPKTNAILCAPTTSRAVTDDVLHPFINLHIDVPTVADNVEATRLKTGLAADNQTIICSTEIPMSATLFTMEDGSIKSYTIDQTINFSTWSRYPRDWVTSAVLLSNFDWHPFVSFTMGATESETGPIIYQRSLLGDIYNYAVLTHSELEQLHRVCLLSEYNCFNGI